MLSLITQVVYSSGNCRSNETTSQKAMPIAMLFVITAGIRIFTMNAPIIVSASEVEWWASSQYQLPTRDALERLSRVTPNQISLRRMVFISISFCSIVRLVYHRFNTGVSWFSSTCDHPLCDMPKPISTSLKTNCIIPKSSRI